VGCGDLAPAHSRNQLITEGSSSDEVDRALDDIEQFLADECGLEVER
jgi:hypothetical protein